MEKCLPYFTCIGTNNAFPILHALEQWFPYLNSNPEGLLPSSQMNYQLNVELFLKCTKKCRISGKDTVT
jgi:hypothetical protein